MNFISTHDREDIPTVHHREGQGGFPRLEPDGSLIAFLMKRGEKAQTQVWMIPVAGGEAVQVTQAEEGVLGFRWHPSGASMGYLALTPRNQRRKKLESKGYGFVFYEENLRSRIST